LRRGLAFGREQHAAREPRRPARLDVRRLVAEDPGTLERDREERCRREQHARRRLAPGMLRIERARDDGIEACGGRAELAVDLGLHAGEILPAVIAAGDPRLVGHDDGAPAARGNRLEQRSRAVAEPHRRYATDIAAILDQHAVAVEEERRARRGLRRGAPQLEPVAVRRQVQPLAHR